MSVSVDPDGAEISAIHELVDFRGVRVLEVGCGDGRVTWRYAETAVSVLALDVNEQKIFQAVEQTPEGLRSKVTFIVADVNHVDIPQDFFDVAVLSHSL